MPERFIHSSHERDVSTKYQTGSEYPTSDQFQMSHSFTSALPGEAGLDPGWFHLGFVWDMCSGTHWVPTRINLKSIWGCELYYGHTEPVPVTSDGPG